MLTHCIQAAVLWPTLLLLLAAASASTAAPPNVLFIAVDDLRTQLGCYGLPHVQSPNLDRLASQGTLFANHYVQVPTCGASRYALLTGRSPVASGVTRSNNAFQKPPTAFATTATKGAQSMPELFRRNDYHTVLIGKISHAPDGRVFAYDGRGDGRPEMPHAWDEYCTPFGPWERGWGAFFAYEGGRHREDRKNNRALMEFVVEKDDELPDGLMANTAVAKLRELQQLGQPFFMGLGFFKPHLPFVATKADWDAFEDVHIPEVQYPERPESKYWHKSGEFYGYAAEHHKSYPLAPADRQQARRAYLACVRYVDRQVGRVITALDTLGLADNTIVVVWGDHGWQLGESALWGKHTPFERSLHSTLMIRAPQFAGNCLRCDAMVETIDLYPTLVDLCSLSSTETQHPLDGKSLRPLLNGTATSIRPCAISYWANAVSVRTHDYRLIARRSKETLTDVELYRLSDGDDPIKNIAETEPAIVTQLSQYME